MINLATTIHDPDAGMKWMSDKYLDQLNGIFDNIYLTSSPYTKSEYLEELDENGVRINKRKDNRIGRTYFDPIERAQSSNVGYVFYCDFDRILHWVKDHSEELSNFVSYLENESTKSGGVDYIVCQRTEEGYKEHQESLYLTEQLPNKIISSKLDLKQPKDFLAGCFIYSSTAAKHIIDQGGHDNLSFFGAWPVLLYQKDVNIEYKKFKGLGWETPDWNKEEVDAAGGIDEFREKLNSKEEWKKRTEMANEFVEEII